MTVYQYAKNELAERVAKLERNSITWDNIAPFLDRLDKLGDRFERLAERVDELRFGQVDKDGPEEEEDYRCGDPDCEFCYPKPEEVPLVDTDYFDCGNPNCSICKPRREAKAKAAAKQDENAGIPYAEKKTASFRIYREGKDEILIRISPTEYVEGGLILSLSPVSDYYECLLRGRFE